MAPSGSRCSLARAVGPVAGRQDLQDHQLLRPCSTRAAGPTIADIPGLGWSAYPDGRLRFLNPAALDYVGVTAEEMREIMEADDYSWCADLSIPTMSRQAWRDGATA